MVSDQVMITIATGFFTLIGTIFTGLMTYFLARLNKKVDTAATKAEEVKESLNLSQKKNDEKLQQNEKKIRQNAIRIEQNTRKIDKSSDIIAEANEKLNGIETVSVKVDEMKETGDKTHALVNGAMLAQMKNTMDALKRVAELTNAAVDIEAARIAEERYKGHLESPMNENRQVL